MSDIKKEVLTIFTADTKQYDSSLKKMDTENKKTTESTSKVTGAINNMNESLSDTIKSSGVLPGKLGNVVSSVSKLTTGFKGLKLAIAATGIGALLIALTSLVQYFTKSADGQEKFLKITKTASAIIGKVVDLFIALGGGIADTVSSTDNAKDSLKSFMDFLKNQVVNRLTALPLFFTKVFQSIKAAVKGNFDEAKESIEDAGFAIAQFYTGLDKQQTLDAVGKVKDFFNETADAASKAYDLAERRNKLDRDEIALITRKAELESRIEQLKLDAANTEKTLQERTIAITEAQRLQNQLSSEQVRLAKEKADIQAGENELSTNSVEDNRELAELQASAFLIQKEQATKLKEMQGTMLALRKEAEGIRDAFQSSLNEAKNIVETPLEDIKLPDVIGGGELESVQALKDAQLKIDEDYYKEQERLAEDNATYQAELRLEEQKQYEALKRNQLNVAGQVAGMLAGMLDEGSEAQKAAAVFEALINTYKGISQAIGSTIPPLNFILAAVTAAAGFDNVKRIVNSKKPDKPKFAWGGIVPGRSGGMIVGQSHANGGVTFGIGTGAEAEGGEFIINKRATSKHLPLLRAINESGLRKFAAGGQVPNLKAEQSRVISEMNKAASSARPVLVREHYTRVNNRIEVIENLSRV